MKLSWYARKHHETRRLLARAANRDMHDACWWLPELLERLYKIYAIEGKRPKLPPEREFRAGCNNYAKELYVSKVSTFVQGKDDLFYQNPVLFGEDWYLCFDDEDDPEVVVRKFKRTSMASARRRAHKVLVAAGVEHTLKESRVSGKRLFPPKWDKFHEATSFFISLDAPIPVPGQCDAVVNSPSGECTFMAWALDFSIDDIEAAFRPNGRLNARMTHLLMGKPPYMVDVIELRRAIIKQLGMGKLIDFEILREQHGDTVKLRRQ